MDTLIKIPLFLGAVMTAVVLVYLVVRFGSRAYFKSRREYENKEK